MRCRQRTWGKSALEVGTLSDNGGGVRIGLSEALRSSGTCVCVCVCLKCAGPAASHTFWIHSPGSTKIKSHAVQCVSV